MPSYVTPGVYFESIDQADQTVSAIRTDVAAFIGIAAQGPLHQPIAVESWRQFQATFGSFIPNGYLAYAANAFFANGGQKMYGVRIAAAEATTATDPAATQPIDGSASLVLSTQGFSAGAVVTARQTAIAQAAGTQPLGGGSSLVDTVSGFVEGSLVEIIQTTPAPVKAWRKIQSVDAVANQLYWDSPLDAAFVLAQPMLFQTQSQADLLLQAVGPGTLTWAGPLGPAFNVQQSIGFETGAAASNGNLYDTNGNATLRIEAFSPGVWGDSLSVFVTNTNLAATATTTINGPQPPTGSASYVLSVAGIPQYSLVKVFQAGSPTPLTGYRVVEGLDAGANLLIWNHRLVPEFDTTQPISFETVEFSLSVYLNGTPKEIHSGLSLVPTHANYVETAVNGVSQYITVQDLKPADPLHLRLPDPTAPQLDEGSLALQGGRDGVAAIRALDFTGDLASSTKWGLRTLEDVDEVCIVAVPDIMIEPAPAVMHAPVASQPPNVCCGPPPALPSAAPPGPAIVEATPQFSLDDVFQVQQAVVAHCEAMQFRFAVLDTPDFWQSNVRAGLGEVQSWRRRFDTEFAALYYPWILVRDPLQLNGQIVRRVPPSGHVVGVYAATDIAVGVHQAPANVALQWAQALTTEVSAAEQGLLNPLGIDCVRTFPGRGLRVYGARTMSSQPIWRFVNVRRLVSMIERALLLSMQWAVFEPNNFMLWKTVKLSITSFLQAVWSKGALTGNTADEAFFVVCDATNNPLATTQLGQLHIDIGVAPALPAEFIVFRIGRTADTLEVSET